MKFALVGHSRRGEAMPADDETMQTVLVVEDEVVVRLMIADYLRECGFKVVEASSADEALTVLKSGISVDLVFSDVQMPGAMDGFGLAGWIRQHRPGLKVILTSGRRNAAAEARELCYGGPLLEKPYNLTLLLDRINRLLGARERFRCSGAA
jgi:CheY-like chemotaxis protein